MKRQRTIFIAASTTTASKASDSEAFAGTDTNKYITPAAAKAGAEYWVGPVVNGRAPAQGLVFDGTSGENFGNATAFGTSDLTMSVWVRPTSFAALQYVYGGAANSCALLIDTGGRVKSLLMDVSNNTDSTTALVLGKWSHLMYVRSGTTGTYYIDGKAAGTTVDSRNYSGATSRLATGNTLSHFPYTGSISRPSLYNRALSAAEVLALYETGAPAAGDYNDAGGNVIATAAQRTFTDNTNWTPAGTASIDTGAGTATIPASQYIAYAIGLVVGKKYRVSGTLTTFTGTGSFQVYDGATQHAVATANGAFSTEITATASSQLTINCPATLSVVLTDISFEKIGLLLAPESNAPGNGYQWKDMSGNKADITLPATGVAWALPDVRNNQLRATLTWAASHEAKTIGLIPANAVITSIITTASAGSSGSGLTVGSVTTPNLLVAAAVYTTAKKVQTLAAQLPAGSATNDLTLVVDPDTANYTGSIQVAVNYLLAQ